MSCFDLMMRKNKNEANAPALSARGSSPTVREGVRLTDIN